MNAAKFYAFLRDEALSELIELNKTTDDLFDVITLGENQHSNMLAWLLNPNEGHHQGDAIVKEFLIAAYNAPEKHVHDNKKFFEQWTPGRIMTTGFGSLFVTREFRMKWEGVQGALDLLLVDPVNEIVVVVENKFGSKLSDRQLEKYVELVRETLPLGGYFKGYDLAFVYLDAYLENLSDADRQALSNRWVHLGYEWLKAAADRAKFQLGKNGSAQLLVSYVQKQTTWDSPDEERRTELASGLAIRHPDVVKQLNDFSQKKKDLWDGRSLKEDHIREAAFFHAQNKDVCTRICEMAGLAAIEHELWKNGFVDDYTELHRKWLWMSSAATEKFQKEDADWPVYIGIHEMDAEYDLHFGCISDRFRDEESAQMVRAALSQDIPELKGRKQRVQLKTGLDREAAIEEADKYLKMINQAAQGYSTV